MVLGLVAEERVAATGTPDEVAAARALAEEGGVPATEERGFFSRLWQDITSAVTGNTAELIASRIPEVRAEMRGAESEAARYDVLEGALTSAGQTEIVTALNRAGPLVQNALGNAFAYNDAFADRVVESLTAEGDQASMLDVLQSMDPSHAPYVADVLNTIASDPNYDMSRLDAVVTTVGRMNTAQTALEAARAANNAEAIAAQQAIIDAAGQQLIEDVRNAGGNVPQIASMRPEMMLAVLGDILNGGDINGILTNVGGQLGLSGQELSDFMAVMGPIAGIIQAVMQPYAELYQQYSPAIPGLMERGENLITAIGGGENDRVLFEIPTTERNPERAAAVETETSELSANGTFRDATTPPPTVRDTAPVIPQQGVTAQAPAMQL
ncbi:MAG: hypothetical protein GW903_00910 [Alphaproteobacteria bacterium]|nr:hypothetical protein [Alphaproteobacteria bacterium]NCQ87529.1 hypothetical protein [Alphaproteobacteria bacterium]NCT06397.1 hypothetical protein [Alphaproteobacteria bacterium]